VSEQTTEGSDDIAVRFLAQGEQTGEDVAGWLADFIGGARSSLDIAMYDFRLSDPLKARLAAALGERAAAGVAIRVIYDADKPAVPDLVAGMDPAPGGTGGFVRSLGYPFRRIDGMKLMHHKYLVRDAGQPAAAVWTGSTNCTDDAWTLEENNVVQVAAPEVAAAYAADFAELWRSGELANTGAADGTTASLAYGGAPATVRVRFSPGQGIAIDHDVARAVAAAGRRVRICSMLLNSGHLLNALLDVVHLGRVAVDGVYDRTQQEQVFTQWEEVAHNRWKIEAVREIVERGLVGKRSTPYSPTSRHDFMHAKVLVVDDTVITGSYNFSNNAEQNAENILFVDSPPLAAAYGRYIDHVKAKYGGGAGG
jgi:phosphatidylserine/phosphatidylglycerophosphate/cardiolipin synthase-like enzyme